MLDGRRHSVDVPLSRTLVALRRVRSLRDPSTNSMSKFSYVDNLTWDTDSCNGINLAITENVGDQSSPGSQNWEERRLENGSVSDTELDFSSKKRFRKSGGSKKIGRVRRRGMVSMKSKWLNESGYSRSNRDLGHGKKVCVGRNDSEDTDYINKALEMAHIVQSPDDHVGNDTRLFGETTTTMLARRDEVSDDKRIRGSKEDGDSVGSPSATASNDMDGSSRNASLFINENLDIMDYTDPGCGISCCWSNTPRLRSSLPSDVEDRPLLTREGREIVLSEREKERGSAYLKNEIVPCSDSPRSLTHKFRPKSFDELVGHNVVASSLMNAISKGKVSSFYLFHGPRGTGKTATSRIFAAALNCLSLEEHRPCQLCRECRMYLSRRSRDIREVDPSKLNRTDRVRSLLKSAVRLPVSSRYKVFIIDECQLLEGETWVTLLNIVDELPRHVVFIMITADLDSLPRSVVSRCQRYHFAKIKEAEIATRLASICAEEELEFDKAALDIIASKCNGSLRDAEIILDQLSLLGKRITVFLVHELIGVVSDEELLDLLYVALSSDTSSTVVRARELMKSRVDPMQLISQLANLIMDILAGRCQTGSSEAKRRFFGTNTSEADLLKLRHALKILSETEKQLRTSKNQTTWLTVALLQLSSVDSSSLDASDPRACLRNQRDDGFCSISSMVENAEHPALCSCCDIKAQTLQMQRDTNEKLEIIWRGALERCQSKTLRSFLQKAGRLSSIIVNQGTAVAEVDFCQLDHVTRAEKSWKVIASSLQFVLGCNVEIRINLVPCRKSSKVKKPSFSILSCSRRMPSTAEDDNLTDISDYSSARAIIKNPTYSSDNGSQFSNSQHNEAGTTIRNNEGNALSMSYKSVQDVPTDWSKVDNVSLEDHHLSIQEPEKQSSCFPRRFTSALDSHTICLRIRPHKKVEINQPSFDTVFCTDDPCKLCSGSNTDSNNNSKDEYRKERKEDNLHCWSASRFPLRKAWQLRPQQQKCWLIPCSTAK